MLIATAKKYLKVIIPFYPVLINNYWKLRRTGRALFLSLIPRSYIFQKYYAKNRWGSDESKSGSGSSLKETDILRGKLQGILKDLKITSLLDAPCGDFHWMQHVDLSGIRYIGADIVSELIERNNMSYKKDNIQFISLDLCHDLLPKVDIILCRDAVVHLSNKDGLAFFDNLRKSKIRYILTTTFPDISSNTDIVTGMWRPINLCQMPFNFPEPIFLLNEGFKGKNGRGQDKSIGLWEVKNILKIQTRSIS